MTDNSVTSSKYRLYHNSDGTPRFYTMEDLPGDYVAVDHETFERGRYDIMVKNSKIIALTDSGIFRYVASNVKTENGVCSDSSDITILVVDNEQHTQHIFWDYCGEQ